jgi:hypothetical protein
MFVYRVFIYPKGKLIPQGTSFSKDFGYVELNELFCKYLSKVGSQHKEIKVKYFVGAMSYPKRPLDSMKCVFYKESAHSAIRLNRYRIFQKGNRKIRPKSCLRSFGKTKFHESFYWCESFKRSEVTITWFGGKVTLNISVPFEVKQLAHLQHFLKFQTNGFPYQISVFESENDSTLLSETCYHDADYLPSNCLEGKKIIVVIMDPLLKKGNTLSWIKKFKEYILIDMYTVALKTYFFNVKKSTGFNNLILTQLLNPFDNFNFYYLIGIIVLFLIRLVLA